MAGQRLAKQVQYTSKHSSKDTSSLFIPRVLLNQEVSMQILNNKWIYFIGQRSVKKQRSELNWSSPN